MKRQIERLLATQAAQLGLLQLTSFGLTADHLKLILDNPGFGQAMMVDWNQALCLHRQKNLPEPTFTPPPAPIPRYEPPVETHSRPSTVTYPKPSPDKPLEFEFMDEGLSVRDYAQRGFGNNNAQWFTGATWFHETLSVGPVKWKIEIKNWYQPVSQQNQNRSVAQRTATPREIVAAAAAHQKQFGVPLFPGCQVRSSVSHGGSVLCVCQGLDGTVYFYCGYPDHYASNELPMAYVKNCE